MKLVKWKIWIPYHQGKRICSNSLSCFLFLIYLIIFCCALRCRCIGNSKVSCQWIVISLHLPGWTRH
ncbi:hypothetical protein EUGRSUZ_G00954 [Eucalyptus grandis]|uniref:Uncharacterized protein n=2 Tax=Eucalyptus grandis TaxID=71139 RepID=A0ACC3K1F9_EUCGR|nr:hypothetical protein EUGRSUZ_G00954 [Eucalyptus grandis]